MIDLHTPDPQDPTPSPRLHGLPAARPCAASEHEPPDEEASLAELEHRFNKDVRKTMFAFPSVGDGPGALCACCGSTAIAVFRQEIRQLPAGLRRQVDEAMAAHDATCTEEECWGRHDRSVALGPIRLGGFEVGPLRLSVLQFLLGCIGVALIVGYGWGRAATYVVLESRRSARTAQPQSALPDRPIGAPTNRSTLPPIRHLIPEPATTAPPRWTY